MYALNELLIESFVEYTMQFLEVLLMEFIDELMFKSLEKFMIHRGTTDGFPLGTLGAIPGAIFLVEFLKEFLV